MIETLTYFGASLVITAFVDTFRPPILSPIYNNSKELVVDTGSKVVDTTLNVVSLPIEIIEDTGVDLNNTLNTATGKEL